METHWEIFVNIIEFWRVSNNILYSTSLPGLQGQKPMSYYYFTFWNSTIWKKSIEKQLLRYLSVNSAIGYQGLCKSPWWVWKMSFLLCDKNCLVGEVQFFSRTRKILWYLTTAPMKISKINKTLVRSSWKVKIFTVDKKFFLAPKAGNAGKYIQCDRELCILTRSSCGDINSN